MIDDLISNKLIKSRFFFALGVSSIVKPFDLKFIVRKRVKRILKNLVYNYSVDITVRLLRCLILALIYIPIDCNYRTGAPIMFGIKTR